MSDKIYAHAPALSAAILVISRSEFQNDFEKTAPWPLAQLKDFIIRHKTAVMLVFLLLFLL